MESEMYNQARAVVYMRVAHAQDESNTAIAAQRAACERIANSYGARLVREYADVGKPARWERQTELQRLLAELAEHRDVAYVVVYDYARLARDLTSLEDILQRITACGAQLATLTGVETAERFAMNKLLDDVAERATSREHAARYPLTLLRAAHRGLGPHQALVVAAHLPNGQKVRGTVLGIGSRLGVQITDGRLVEDVRAEWVVSATVQQPEQTR